MEILLRSLFENNLLNTPPGEISGIKIEDSIDVAQYIVKGSKLLHINKKAAKEYPRALGQNVSRRWYS